MIDVASIQRWKHINFDNSNNSSSSSEIWNIDLWNKYLLTAAGVRFLRLDSSLQSNFNLFVNAGRLSLGSSQQIYVYLCKRNPTQHEVTQPVDKKDQLHCNLWTLAHSKCSSIYSRYYTLTHNNDLAPVLLVTSCKYTASFSLVAFISWVGQSKPIRGNRKPIRGSPQQTSLS